MNMWRVATAILFFLVIISGACSNEHGDSPAAFLFEAPDPPTELEVTPGENEMTLDWSYPDILMNEVSEFRIYYYNMYGIWELIGKTKNRSHVHDRLIGDMEYCYKVSAVNLDGNEGWRTKIICEMTSAFSRQGP